MIVSGLLLAAIAGLEPPEPSPLRSYAIVVGYNQSSNPSRSPLRYADEDAARWYELLARSTVQSFLLTELDASSSELFPELVEHARPPSAAELERVIRIVQDAIVRDRAAGHPTEVYFYYAGHGDIEDGSGYITLRDGPYSSGQFRSAFLEGPKADRTHVIIDACKSFHFLAGRGPSTNRRPYEKPYAGPPRLPGVGYILSTSDDASAHEWSAVSGGIFSHEVRSALVGGADVNRDGAVDYAELGAFVALANASIPSPQFRPRVFIRPPLGNPDTLVFRPAGALSTARLRFPDRGGRFSVVDDRGLRYADLHQAEGLSLEITLLRPFSYDVHFGDETYVVSTRGGDVELASLSADRPAVAARGAAHRAFEHLFENPMSPDVVQGFRLAGFGSVEPAPDAVDTEAQAASGGRSRRMIGLGLSGAGLVAIGTGVALAFLAADTQGQIGTAPSVDREGLTSEANALTAGSAVSVSVGVGSLVSGLILLVTQ